MYIPSFSDIELPYLLQAVASAVSNQNTPTQREKQFLEVLNAMHNGSINQVELLANTTFTPSQIAQVITDPYQCIWLIQMGIVMAMVEGKSTIKQLPKQIKILRSLAQVLSVKEPGLRILGEVARSHKLLAQLDVSWHIMRKLVRDAYLEEGIVGVKNLIQPTFFGTGGKNPYLASKFRKLGLLPKDTLGYAFWEHFTQRNISFPGEWGAIPERFVYHDFGHILSGYDTDPIGEIIESAFQAGHTCQDGFMFFLFAILHHHWGIKITPVIEPFEGLFDIPLVMHALQRGAACKVDISDHWNFWEVVELPLEEVRDLYGIPPLCPASLKVPTTAGII